jgi:hypothetical protein
MEIPRFDEVSKVRILLFGRPEGRCGDSLPHGHHPAFTKEQPSMFRTWIFYKDARPGV